MLGIGDVVGMVGGAAIGLIMAEVAYAVRKMKRKAKMFAPRLRELEIILGFAESVVEFTHYNNQINNELGILMSQANKLVHKCSTFRHWEYIRRVRYQKKLLRLNWKLVDLLIKYIQYQNQRYQMQNQNQTTLLALISLRDKMMMDAN